MTKQVILVEKEVLCAKVEDFVLKAEEIKKTIDAEFHDSIRFDVNRYYNSYSTNESVGLFISYNRYETDEEYQKRLGKENDAKAKQEQRERDEFERLQKKFGK